MGRETHKLRVLTYVFNQREVWCVQPMNNYVILGLTPILMKIYYSPWFIIDVKPIASLMYTSGIATLKIVYFFVTQNTFWSNSVSNFMIIYTPTAEILEVGAKKAPHVECDVF